MNTQTSKGRALAGLAATLIFCLLPVGRWIAPGQALPSLLIRELLWWIYTAIILAWLRFGEGLPLASIGLRRPTWKSFGFALLAAFVSIAIMGVQFSVVIPKLHLDASAILAQQRTILALPYWFRVLLVLRAGVVEEILFRGYLIEKVRQLTGSIVAAVALSVIAFAFAHLSGWGWVQLMPVATIGLLFALLYAWRRDLPSKCSAISSPTPSASSRASRTLRRAYAFLHAADRRSRSCRIEEALPPEKCARALTEST